MRIRQPIVAVLGHVDSGKTSLLDNIRGTGVQGREAGGITQHIGASFLPDDVIRKRCGSLYKRLERTANKIPGVLVIDTPGHEVFTNLRSRGGSAADIAILVVDVNRGFQQQTNESLKILQSKKVPFVVALNKIDQISGWRSTKTTSVIEAMSGQDASIAADLDQKIYDVVGTLSVLGYRSEAFHRVSDFAKEVALVPISARTGVGVPEILTVLVGLTQQYMINRLKQEEKPTRGLVLEVNDEPGMGPTANMILVDGTISKSDTILVAKRDGIIVTRPKAIMLPKPLDEMRDPRDKFRSVGSVKAAAGVKIASPDLDGVLPGSTVCVAHTPSEIKPLRDAIESEMRSVFVETKTDGVIIKCDTIGSLEAIIEMLRRQSIPVARADIGPVNKRDVVEAEAIKGNDRHLGVILAFNVKTLHDAQAESEMYHVRIFNDNVIYRLLDSYTEWVAEDSVHEEDSAFDELTPIAKFTFLRGMTFHNKDPAVFGIRVDVGTLRQKTHFANERGKKIGTIHQLQDNKKPVDHAPVGAEVACSVHGGVIGRNIREEETYYTLPHSYEAKQLLGRFRHRLSPEELQVLDHIIRTQRGIDPAYGY